MSNIEFSIIGDGILGRALHKRFIMKGLGNKVAQFSRSSTGLNFCEPECISTFANLPGNWIINCCGATRAMIETGGIPINEAVYINAVFPKLLASACSTTGKKLIHISTDCVFSGNTGNYTEQSITDPTDIYGVTKLCGENIGDDHLVIRTSFIGHGVNNNTGLLDFVLSQANQKKKSIPGYTTHMYSGLTSNYLSDAIIDIINNKPFLSGLYQIAGDCITKEKLISLIVSTWDLSLEVIPTCMPTKNMTLNCTKFSRITGWKRPNWYEMLSELKQNA